MDLSARKWNSILYSNRAAANMALNQFQDAVMDCHNAIAKDPTFYRAYLRRARAYKVNYTYYIIFHLLAVTILNNE